MDEIILEQLVPYQPARVRNRGIVNLKSPTV